MPSAVVVGIKACFPDLAPSSRGFLYFRAREGEAQWQINLSAEGYATPADCRLSNFKEHPAHHVYPTLTAQLESLGGEIYEVPLSVRATRGLLLALAGWEPLCEAMKGFEYPERPKSQ